MGNVFNECWKFSHGLNRYMTIISQADKINWPGHAERIINQRQTYIISNLIGYRTLIKTSATKFIY